MISREFPIIPAPSISFAQSSSCRFPVRILWESTLDSRANRRFTSCSLLISRLKMATDRSFRKAIYWAIFSTNAVFPMDGLAATRIRSEGCRPEVL